MTQNRKFTPYEINQLKEYGLQETDPISVGEKPVEYITGHAEFCHHDFLVSQSVLIPRIETEEIIDIVSKNTSAYSKDQPLNIADIGTGSGCLGISTALSLFNQGFKKLHLYLSDISPEALKIAQLNADRLLPKSIDVITFQSDLLNSYPVSLKINLLLANLPYIPSNRIKTLDSSVIDFEPHLALDGGPDGTTLINKLLSQLPHFLGEPFSSVFEIDSGHKLADFHIPSDLEANLKEDSFNRTRFLTIKTHNI